MRPWQDLPLFTRSDDTGGTLEGWQRRDMLVVVLHPSGCSQCDAARTQLRREEGRARSEGVLVVVVTVGDPQEDPAGRVSATIARAVGSAPGEPMLIVSDRFARFYAALRVHGRPPEETLREAWEWMDFVRNQCEECGAPLNWE